MGIECESIEGQSWGVGRIVKKLLEGISKRPELQKEFRFFLYFKSGIPDFDFLDNPIFVKKIVTPPFLPDSFSLYYYVLLPIRLWFEGLNVTLFPNYMLPILFRGKSLVYLTEDIYYEIKHGSLPFRYKLAYKIFAGWAARHAIKIICVSNTSAKEVARLFGISPDRIVINQSGIDEPIKNRIALDEKTGNYLLYVGQAFPRRHLKETILAFEKMAVEFLPIFTPDQNDLGKIGTNLKLIAIGQDKYNPPVIKELVSEVNKKLGGERVIHEEYVSQQKLEGLYGGAKLVIYVSSSEAFGFPPLEGLSHGVPPVVADSELNREIYGNMAFFVKNPDDVESIAGALREGLLNEEKRNAIKQSAPEILGKYTWEKHTDRFIEICRNFK
ncbi:MAG: glycosyltransferase family 1 protein [bacterium]|nr:glycosyltransferase family 1 protein [bacterium]